MPVVLVLVWRVPAVVRPGPAVVWLARVAAREQVAVPLAPPVAPRAPSPV